MYLVRKKCAPKSKKIKLWPQKNPPSFFQPTSVPKISAETIDEISRRKFYGDIHKLYTEHIPLLVFTSIRDHRVHRITAEHLVEVLAIPYHLPY